MSREWLLSKGWRRHSIVSHKQNSLAQLLPALPSKVKSIASLEEAILIIATYDCAVVNPCFEVEPWIQLLVAFPVELEKKFTEGRDPRRIHFRLNHLGIEKTFETNAAGIVQVNREKLCEISPDNDYHIIDSSKYDLKNWLAERYKQDTWPDAFNSAIKPRESRLKRFWTRYNNYISSLYIKLNTYEELEDSNYSASIIVALGVGKQRGLIKQLRKNNKQLTDKGLDKVITHFSSEIITIFEDVIIIEDDPTTDLGKAVEVIEENSLTVHQLKNFFRFSPYSLSNFESESPLPMDMKPNRAN